MIKPQIYKGIEYVRLSELPETQQRHLSKTLSKGLIIKILVGGSIIADCIQYKDYVLWYKNVFSQQSPAVHNEISKAN